MSRLTGEEWQVQSYRSRVESQERQVKSEMSMVAGKNDLLRMTIEEWCVSQEWLDKSDMSKVTYQEQLEQLMKIDR